MDIPVFSAWTYSQPRHIRSLDIFSAWIYSQPGHNTYSALNFCRPDFLKRDNRRVLHDESLDLLLRIL